jgi:hypothetical protein
MSSVMTVSLKKAFEKARGLSEAAQDQLAEQLMEELCGEDRWDRTLKESQPLLERLAKKALRERKAGRTTSQGFDEL